VTQQFEKLSYLTEMYFIGTSLLMQHERSPIFITMRITSTRKEFWKLLAFPMLQRKLLKDLRKILLHKRHLFSSIAIKDWREDEIMIIRTITTKEEKEEVSKKAIKAFLLQFSILTCEYSE
jgi:biotin-(acetyl-CoA carboxylase) ligase